MIIKDKPSHFANEGSNMINMSQQYYEVTISNAIVTTNTLATLNSYHALLKVWSKANTGVYLHIKDSAGTYMDFIKNTTNTDYLLCRIVGDIEDGISHGKKTISLKLEECS